MFNLSRIRRIEGSKNFWMRGMAFALLMTGLLSGFNKASANTIDLQTIESVTQSNSAAYSYLADSRSKLNFIHYSSEKEYHQPSGATVLENHQNYLKSEESPPYSSKNDNLYRKDLGLNKVSSNSLNVFVAIADKNWKTFYCDNGNLEIQYIKKLPNFHSKILSNGQHIYVFAKSGVLLGFAKPMDKVPGKDEVVIQFGKSILVFDKKSPINYKGIAEVLICSKVKSNLKLDKINVLIGINVFFLAVLILPDIIAKSRKNKTLRCIDEIINGEYSKNSLKVKKLLKSKNKDIIKAIYENIEKIAITEEDLLKFLRKNKLEINQMVVQCFT